MESVSYLMASLAQLAGKAPALIFWIGVIVFGSIMHGRGGGRAERLLIAGGGVKILAGLLSILLAFVTFWMVNRGSSMQEAAGTLCLIYAFWVRFKEWKTAEADNLEPERGPDDAVPE
jgi:hypothetical protein